MTRLFFLSMTCASKTTRSVFTLMMSVGSLSWPKHVPHAAIKAKGMTVNNERRRIEIVEIPILTCERFAARIAKTRGGIVLDRVARCAGEAGAQISAARRAVSRAGARGRAACAAA